jgi:hypothetical protein
MRADATQLPSTISDLIAKSTPAWVMPVCDDVGFVRTSVVLADEPTRLRVIQGDQPADVPELVFPQMVFPRDVFPRITGLPASHFTDWERGIGMTPESAVAVAAAQLAGTGARVAEVPDAFTLVLPPPSHPKRAMADQPFIQTHACSRWRLTLDRPVVLRGLTSGHVSRTRFVYVVAGAYGCGGVPIMQIPRPAQPRTLTFFSYVVRDPVVQSRGDRPAEPSPPEIRSIALRVTEPIWFEEARLRP